MDHVLYIMHSGSNILLHCTPGITSKCPHTCYNRPLSNSSGNWTIPSLCLLAKQRVTCLQIDSFLCILWNSAPRAEQCMEMSGNKMAKGDCVVSFYIDSTQGYREVQTNTDSLGLTALWYVSLLEHYQSHTSGKVCSSQAYWRQAFWCLLEQCGGDLLGLI